MKPHINAVTLAVADLETSLRFYRDGLGLATDGIVGTEFAGSDTEPAGSAVMFTLDSGLVLALYPASELALDAGVDGSAVAGHGFSLGHPVDSDEEVDAVLAAAGAAGGRVLGTHVRPWGMYAGYFADPDGHLWEVLHFREV